MVASFETGRVPDVAEPFVLNGHVANPDIPQTTIEPLIGARKVVLVRE